MKKNNLKISTLVLGLVSLSVLTLSGCSRYAETTNDKNTATTQAQSQSKSDTNDQANKNQVKNVYVTSFNSTDSFIKRYTDAKFDFNASLPLRGKFVNLLNELSQASSSVENLKGDELNRALALDLFKLVGTFNNIIDDYQQNPTEATKEFKANGLSIDLDSASLTELLGQLSDGCKANNNYAVDLKNLVTNLKITDKNGKVLPFPDSEKKYLESWNTNFAGACSLVAKLYDYTQQKGFNYEELTQKVKEFTTPEAFKTESK